MSYWTYINGIVTVSPMGRTQAEKRYILETVLDHLPRVTGSEGNMKAYIIQKDGYNSSSSHTEFGEWGGYYGWDTLSTEVQHEYLLVINVSLRDRMFDQTYREFQKWLCRLAKRVFIEDILVEVTGQNKSSLIHGDSDRYRDMWENPSWYDDEDATGESNWCEYLMWERARNYDYPMKLAYKYFNDPENDAEVERRMEYERGE